MLTFQAINFLPAAAAVRYLRTALPIYKLDFDVYNKTIPAVTGVP
jgi:hypothetical protein